MAFSWAQRFTIKDKDESGSGSLTSKEMNNSNSKEDGGNGNDKSIKTDSEKPVTSSNSNNNGKRVIVKPGGTITTISDPKERDTGKRDDYSIKHHNNRSGRGNGHQGEGQIHTSYNNRDRDNQANHNNRDPISNATTETNARFASLKEDSGFNNHSSGGRLAINNERERDGHNSKPNHNRRNNRGGYSSSNNLSGQSRSDHHQPSGGKYGNNRSKFVTNSIRTDVEIGGGRSEARELKAFDHTNVGSNLSNVPAASSSLRDLEGFKVADICNWDDDELNDHETGGFDQFSANQKLTGVVQAEFSEEFYSTKLDITTFTDDQIQDAKALAAEIMHNGHDDENYSDDGGFTDVQKKGGDRRVLSRKTGPSDFMVRGGPQARTQGGLDIKRGVTSQEKPSNDDKKDTHNKEKPTQDKDADQQPMPTKPTILHNTHNTQIQGASAQKKPIIETGNTATGNQPTVVAATEETIPAIDPELLEKIRLGRLHSFSRRDSKKFGRHTNNILAVEKSLFSGVPDRCREKMSICNSRPIKEILSEFKADSDKFDRVLSKMDWSTKTASNLNANAAAQTHSQPTNASTEAAQKASVISTSPDIQPPSSTSKPEGFTLNPKAAPFKPSTAADHSIPVPVSHHQATRLASATPNLGQQVSDKPFSLWSIIHDISDGLTSRNDIQWPVGFAGPEPRPDDWMYPVMMPVGEPTI